MDRDYSLERRYSFSFSKNPAAESTKLNHSNANRSGSGSSFKWGSTTISPKRRSNSSANLINLDSTVAVDVLESSRSRNMRKIDPRIVADVQSKGLASRIVKYHENGNRLNRSMSAHNLYSKPGQFPVVTLKKTDLPYRATKQNVSMTRIAPPEKSVFYGSTLSSLLRSNSVVGLHKSDEDISRENRPILHPPPTENDMAPTRSVLDVLKEISRKRINSDDPDVVETSKKNRFGNDLVDTGAQTVMTHSFKRQRDLNSPQNGDAISPSKHQDTRFSPEQAKKRVCNYNNDIASSLSSSVKRKTNVNKRPSYQLNQTMPTYLEPYETQKNKTPKCDDRFTITDIRFKNLENPTSNTVNPNVDTSSKSDGAIPPRSESESIPFESGRPTVPNNKPRLTLFNKAYDVSNGSCRSDEVDDNVNVSGECAGIQFVKPKKIASTGLKNPGIERAQKSKLALMLSGLRGELYYESDNDELDAPPPQPKQDKKDDNETNAAQDKKVPEGASAVTVAPSAALQTTSTISSNISAIAGAVTAASKLPEKADSTNSTTQFTVKNATSNSSPLVGLKLTPPSAAANVATTQKTGDTQIVSTPTLQGFPCSLATSLAQPLPSFKTTTAATLATTVSLSSMAQTTFVSKPAASTNTNQSGDLTKSSTNATNLANISFGNVAKTTPTTAVPANTFAFSSVNGITTNTASNSVFTNVNGPPLTVQTPSIVTPAASMAVSSSSSTTATTMFSNSFSFGSNVATTSAPSQSQTFAVKPVATTASASAGSFSFGSPSNLQVNSVTPAVKSSGAIAMANATTAAAANTQFSFGSVATPTNNNTPTAANTFSFGSSNKDTPSMFSAGAPKATPTLTTVAETTRPSFGLPATSTTPVFGSTATTTASNMFGSTNPQVQSIFGSAAPKTTFGSESSKPSSSVFGGSSAANNVLPAVNFGQPTADKPGSVNKSTASAGGFSFGATNSATPGSGAFTFGGTNNTSNANSSNTAPAPTGQSANFSFGAGTGASAPEKNNSSNLFGGSASAAPTGPSSGGFSFGSGAGTVAAQKPSSTFAFGAHSSSSIGGNSSLSSPGGGFSFGAVMQQKTNEPTLAKTFNFGSSVSNNNQALAPTGNNPVATNMFAPNMMNKPSSPAFNFGAGAGASTPQATVAPAAANNIFAPSAPMTAPGSGDRPIRRATRRLQK